MCGDKSCKQTQPFVNIITQGSCRICIRAIISQHDIKAFTAHTHCRGKGIFEKSLTLTINCQLSRFAKFVLNILSNLIWSGPTVVRARKDNVSLMEFRARGNVANIISVDSDILLSNSRHPPDISNLICFYPQDRELQELSKTIENLRKQGARMYLGWISHFPLLEFSSQQHNIEALFDSKI